MSLLRLQPLQGAFTFDLIAFFEDGDVPSREDALRREVVQAFMVPPCVVVVDEVPELPFKVTRQVVVFEQDAVFERAVPALDLALRLRMIRLAARVRNVVVLQPVLEF